MQALITRFAITRVFTIDGLGEQTGGAGLTSASGASEEISMSEIPGIEGIFQSANDWLLTNEFSKGLRAPFAVERL